MIEHSVLQPLSEGCSNEKEKSSNWVARKAVGSLPGRVVMASFETLRATGTSVICLSPWGDSSPLLLPCIRLRDVAIHTIDLATGGAGSLITPIMGEISAMGCDTVVSNIAVKVLEKVADSAGDKALNLLANINPRDLMSSDHAKKMKTTSVKTMSIKLQYKNIIGDAALGYYRSPEHKDTSLIASVAGYLAIENGWLSPYLFASGRRPVIPRKIRADVVFTHGPFLAGDYEVAETLVAQSSMVIHFCTPPPPKVKPQKKSLLKKLAVRSAQATLDALTEDILPVTLDIKRLSSLGSTSSKLLLRRFTKEKEKEKEKEADVLASPISMSTEENEPDSPEPTQAEEIAEEIIDATPVATPIDEHQPNFEVHATDLDPTSSAPAPPRRMIITLLGIKPHRLGMWSSSARPGESIMKHLLLNGCPAIIVPVLHGSPLLAWDTLTLAKLHSMAKKKKAADGVVRVIFEFVDLCVDWDRVVIPAADSEEDGKDIPPQAQSDVDKKALVKAAIATLVEACMRSVESKEVKKSVDADRAGIVMFRMP